MSSIYCMKREYGEIEIADEVYVNYENAIKLAIQNPQKNWEEQITECLNKRIDINYGIGNHRETALISAVKCSQQNLFKFLIKHGANVNTCNDDGYSPLHFNTIKLKNNEKFDISIFEELLKRGANLHAQTKTTQETPLYWIAKFGTDKLMKLSLQYGANIHEKDVEGCTPLAQAIINKKYDLIKILLWEAEALLINIDDLTGGSAFHLAIELPKENIENIITHAGFDYFKERYPEQKQKMNEIIEAFYVFKQIGIPKEMIFSILSKLLPEYFINEKFCQYLLYLGYKPPYIFYQTNKRVMCLKSILQGNMNYKRQTAEFLLIEQSHDPQYIAQVKDLFNGHQLTEDMKAFHLAFPDKINELKQNNLALRIYKNIEKKLNN